MEKNVSFPAQGITEFVGRLAWAQLELFADDVPEIQVMAAGDERTVEELRIEENNGKLLVEQPQYGLSMNINASKWMQVCIRIPKGWGGNVDAHTISGLLSARGIRGKEVILDTISGDVRAMAVHAEELSLRTISGDIKGGDLVGEKLSLRTVSGEVKLQSIAFSQVRSSAVSGAQWMEFKAPFARVDATTVSGEMTLHVPMDRMDASLRSVSGRMRTAGIHLQENGPVVRLNSVSAGLELISTLKPEKA